MIKDQTFPLAWWSFCQFLESFCFITYWNFQEKIDIGHCTLELKGALASPIISIYFPHSLKYWLLPMTSIKCLTWTSSLPVGWRSSCIIWKKNNNKLNEIKTKHDFFHSWQYNDDDIVKTDHTWMAIMCTHYQTCLIINTSFHFNFRLTYYFKW